jgi:hypothetical protein
MVQSLATIMYLQLFSVLRDKVYYPLDKLGSSIVDALDFNGASIFLCSEKIKEIKLIELYESVWGCKTPVFAMPLHIILL